MKTHTLATLILLAAVSISAPAQSISSFLKGLKSSTPSTDTTATTKSKAADALGAIVGAVTSGIKSTDITGTWVYSGPAVTFQSDNILMKAGGAVGSSSIEKKLAPVYDKAGLNNMVLTVAADSTFTLKTPKTTLKGKVEYGEKTIFLDFKAFGKVNIGKMEADVTGLTSKTLKLTFDASKLTKLVTSLSSVAGGQIASAAKLLEKYDGTRAGFALKRQ